MIKVAMIGAGSVVFSRNLTGDILGIPEFRDAHLCYMDVDKDRLEVAGRLCRKLADAVGATPRIETTMDRAKALKGADFVINMVQIGGFNSTLVDFEIPRKYGLNFTIADTTGPGGLFRALRTYPMLSGLVKDMERQCPGATLLNYSNPMSMNMQTVFRTGSVRAVGLCHSVQGTFDQLMRYLGEKPEDVAFTCAGINHMAFYLEIRKGGEDLYPRLFAAMADPKVYASNKVRFELMRRLGHFVTESSEHNAEYCAHFIPHGEDCIARFDVPIDEYLRRCDGIVDEFERLRTFARSSEPMRKVHASHEYCSTIMHSIATGKPSVIYGNLPNGGTIANLPRTAIVEAPTLVDRTGLHHVQVGDLPPQLVGYVQPHITQHELFIRAAMEGRRDHVYQACIFDPLTAATLTMDRIVEMCDEMIAAYGGELPTLKHRSLVPGSGRTFPKVDSRTLRASWERAQRQSEAGCIRDWHVLGAFKSPEPGKVTLAMKTPVEADFARRRDGSVDLAATYAVGKVAAAAAAETGTSTAPRLAWKKASAGKRGYVDLDHCIGREEWACAYAYAEIASPQARAAVLRCGSDDGIKIWLNGRVVHEHEIGRGYSPNADSAAIELEAGVNRVLVKIDNYIAGWGFGVAISEPGP
jgi:alpha-galactosidase